MENEYNFSLSFNWKESEELIQIIAEKKKIEKKQQSENLSFLKEIRILDEKLQLTQIGYEFYKEKFILFNEKEALNIISSLLTEYKPVIVICSLLWGFPNLNKESIHRVLLTSNSIDKNTRSEDLSNFIMLLNKCNILKYSKKLNLIRIVFNPKSVDIDSHKGSFISPETPFSNIKNFKQIIRSCKKFIYWVDKHFSGRGLELLIDELDGNIVSEVKILLSKNSNINFDRFRKDFKRFKAELKNKKISSNCRIILDKDVVNDIHGRWIISEKSTFNIPPINSILKGQYDEFLETKEILPFDKWWNVSEDIINDWNNIQKSLGNL